MKKRKAANVRAGGVIFFSGAIIILLILLMVFQPGDMTGLISGIIGMSVILIGMWTSVYILYQKRISRSFVTKTEKEKEMGRSSERTSRTVKAIIAVFAFTAAGLLLWWLIPATSKEAGEMTAFLSNTEAGVLILLLVAIVAGGILWYRREAKDGGDEKGSQKESLYEKGQRRRRQRENMERGLQIIGLLLFIAGVTVLALDKTAVYETLETLSQIEIHTQGMEVLWFSSFVFLGMAVILYLFCQGLGAWAKYSYAFGTAGVFLLIFSQAPMTLPAFAVFIVFCVSTLLLLGRMTSWGFAGLVASALVLSPLAPLFF